MRRLLRLAFPLGIVAIMLAAPSADLVRPQHLLLALVADPDGIGSGVLTQLGVTPEKLRVTIDRLSAG